MDHHKIISDIKGLKKEHMISEVKTAFDVALFKKDVMAHVTSDVQKTKFGYYIIVVGAILGFLGMQIFGGWAKPTIVGGLINMVVQAVMAVVGIYVMSYVAKKLFKGAAEHDHFFRVAAYGMILMWASILPAVGMIAGLWGLALIFVILKTVHKMTTGGAIGTLIVTVILYMVVGAVIGALGLSTMGGGFGGSKSFNYGGMKINTPGGSIDFNIPNIK
jgi:hypothetical protein